VEGQLAHARAFVGLLEPTGPWLDLGSGGGLPGLVLLDTWPGAHGTLLDATARRTVFLAEALEAMGVTDRATVVTARAEEAARDPALRGSFRLVVARSFGPPAVTAECAAPLLGEAGTLAVSEPPDADPTRWPTAPLAELGLDPPEVRTGAGATVALLTKSGPTPDRYPRRTGIPTKRPLW
jgi:16S rRNA (guanine527-N7)-methyltransferase